jgi:Polysaccharide lyase
MCRKIVCFRLPQKLRSRHMHKTAPRFLGVLAVCVLIMVTFGSSVRATRPARPWWSRTFEPPETLPQRYPFCCGRYWDTLLLSSTSTGTIVADPVNRRNHVFAAQVGPNNGGDYADWSLLTQNALTSHGSGGRSVWIRLRLYFPRGFKPSGYTAGQIDSEWNWLTEFHEAAGWVDKCASENPATVALGILNSHQTRANYLFRLHLLGGVQTTSNCKPIERRIDGPRVQLGHWYSLLEHIVFSPSRDGLVQIWIDGRRMVNIHFPTVYRHPDGGVGQYYFNFGYYRLRGSWTAKVLYDNVAEGPTRGSISPGGNRRRR